jgi:hypothetical protein
MEGQARAQSPRFSTSQRVPHAAQFPRSITKEIEVVKLLVARWPEGVQERNAKFQTPLHLAVERNLKDVVELLAKYWPQGPRAVEEEAKIEREKIEAKRAMSGRR